MATKMSKAVYRETVDVKIHDCGKKRELICGFEPGDVVSVRMKGTRQVFRISARSLYEYAAKLHGEAARRAKL